MSFIRAPIDRICVENPVGIMSTVYAKPTQIIQPYQFGHDESKKTCLWLKNLPKLKPTKIVEPVMSLVMDTWHLPKEERWKVRSVTYQGIADAMADQWTNWINIK